MKKVLIFVVAFAVLLAACSPASMVTVSGDWKGNIGPALATELENGSALIEETSLRGTFSNTPWTLQLDAGDMVTFEESNNCLKATIYSGTETREVTLAAPN